MLYIKRIYICTFVFSCNNMPDIGSFGPFPTGLAGYLPTEKTLFC